MREDLFKNETITKGLRWLLMVFALLLMPLGVWGEDYVLISNYAELKAFAAQVNSGYPGLKAKLTADIVCKNDPNDEEYDQTWVPIGDASSPYKGEFLGQGHTITGLSNASVTNLPKYAGMFGRNEGTVANFTLKDATIKGKEYVGGIVGENNGTVSFCGLVGSSSIISNGNSESLIGGIAGSNKKTIELCYVAISGSISAKADGSIELGGISGDNGGTIEKCYVAISGSISAKDANVEFGGISGRNYAESGNSGYIGGTIQYCHNSSSGAISINSSYDTYFGGLVGRMGLSNSTSTIKHSYYAGTGAVTIEANNKFIGGVIGYFISNINTTFILHCYYLDNNSSITKPIGNSSNNRSDVKGLTADDLKSLNISDNWIQGLNAPLLKGMPYIGSISAVPTAASLTYNGDDQALLATNGTATGTFHYRVGTTGDWSTTPPSETAAGTYYVYYYINPDVNHTADNLGSSSSPLGPIAVTIGKAPLTVTANNHSIIYGNEPSHNFVSYDGFVNGETSTVLGGKLSYDINYQQYGDVGNTYTITPSGLTSKNYDISYETGTLQVGPKTVGVKWEETVLTYSGAAQAPTATATGLIAGDECIVTVEGQQTAVGEGYTATATGLTGAKSGNYKLSTTGLSADFEIAPQLSVQFAAGQQWATWYDERTTHNYIIPEGIKGYVVKDVIGTKVIVEELSLGYLPAQTGLLLKRTNTTAAQDIASNIFTGNLSNTVPSSLLTVDSPMPVVAYLLQNDEFYATTGNTLPEHGCYLPDLGSTTTIDVPSAILGPNLIPAQHVEANKPYVHTFSNGTWMPCGDAMTYLPVDFNLDEGTVSLVKIMGAPNGLPVVIAADEDSQTTHYFMVSVSDKETVQSILDDYKSKTATMNGRFVITDGTKTITEIISGAGVTAGESLILVLADGKFSTVDISAADLDKKAKAGLLLFILTKWEYMHIKPSNGNSPGKAGSRTINIIGDNTTGIEEMYDAREMMTDAWYDLQGRKIDQPTKKGLYIQNGKKIVIR